jgi:hypothetical protein
MSNCRSRWLIARRFSVGIAQYRRQAPALHRPGGLAVRDTQSRHTGEIEQGRITSITWANWPRSVPQSLSLSGHETMKLTRRPPPPV